MTDPRHEAARAALRAGRIADAEAACADILGENPDDPEALLHLAAIRLQQGRPADAHDAMARAVVLSPSDPRMHNALGQTLTRQKRYDEAELAFEAALALNPRDPDAYANLGAMLFERGQYEDAELVLRKSLIHHPQHLGAAANLGRTLLRLHRPKEAIPLFHAILQLQPDDAHAQVNIGIGCVLVGDLESAHEAFEHAIRNDPGNIEAHVNFAHLLLLQGELSRGWEQHEWRLKRPGYRNLDAFTSPLWQGEDIAGKTILLWAEQGLGDTVQFVRYVPLVAARGAKVVVECHPVMHRLVSRMPGIAAVFGIDEGRGYDVHVPLMSLPHRFGCAAIPDRAPYLPVPPAADLGPHKGRRVGLVWAGNPRHARDRERSRRLVEFGPLAHAGNNTFYALQKGDAALERPPDGMTLVDLGIGFRDFADTAAAMAALDLVISIDSAPAHLAGALGVPVWVLLPRMPDWRWGLQADGTPWYPTMRLFRETAGWPDLFGRVAAALSQFPGK